MMIQGRNEELSVGSKTNSFRATRSQQEKSYACPQAINGGVNTMGFGKQDLGDKNIACKEGAPRRRNDTNRRPESWRTGRYNLYMRVTAEREITCKEFKLKQLPKKKKKKEQ